MGVGASLSLYSVGSFEDGTPETPLTLRDLGYSAFKATVEYRPAWPTRRAWEKSQGTGVPPSTVSTAPVVNDDASLAK